MKELKNSVMRDEFVEEVAAKKNEYLYRVFRNRFKRI